MKGMRLALVTDAGNGLGSIFANILIQNNYKVLLAASKESFKVLSLDSDALHNFKLIEVDFSSSKSLSGIKDVIESKYGRLDLLINNAEIANGFGQKIDQIKMEDVREVYEYNVFAVIGIIQLLKPLLEKSDDPRIINITSALGDISRMKDDQFYYSDYCVTAYASSKAALNMFTHLQSKEFIPSKIKIDSFDPVALNNCTHNSVAIRDSVMDEFVSLIRKSDVTSDS